MTLCLSAIALSVTPVQAQVVRSTFAARAQGLHGEPIPTITVWPGAGANLNFIPSGETVQKAWLDDPSRITLDFDGQMCSKADDSSDCTSSPVTVVHLKQINAIKFTSLPTTPSTLLTVVTQGSQGRQLYQFQVLYGTGKPQYHALAIYPDSDKPPQTASSDTSLNSVERGLAIAQSQQWVSPQSPVWGRIQDFLELARSGVNEQEAAQRAGVSIALVKRLVQLGTANKEASRSPETSLGLVNNRKNESLKY